MIGPVGPPPGTTIPGRPTGICGFIGLLGAGRLPGNSGSKVK